MLKHKEKSIDHSTIIHSVEEFPEEKWLAIAKEELHETPEKKNQELGTLKYLLNNESNLVLPADDEYLLRFLRARKFDSKKAFNMLQRYYLMKLKCPQLFQCSLPSQVENVFQLQAQVMLDDRDQFGRRVYVIRVDNFDATKVTIDEIFRTNIMALEHVVREEKTQIAGISVLLDMNGLSLNHAKFFTPYYAKKMVELVQETFPLRFKGFHVVNEPFYFDAIMAVLKPFLKDKIRKRIYLHGNDMNSLHAFLSPQILPKEYGGKLGAFDNRSWHLQLLKEEQYFADIRKFGYVNSAVEEVDTDDDLLK